ncbi:MAG: HAD family hydrolase [bacterium]|nr:HAD family hydrolase [bacterium]
MTEDINQNLLDKIRRKKAIIWDFDGVLCFCNWSYGEDFHRWWGRLWDLLEEFDPHIREKYKGKLKNTTDLAYPYEHTDYIAQKYGETSLQKINAFYLKKELLILPVSPINTKIVEIIKNSHIVIEHYIWSNNQGIFIKKVLEKAGLLHAFKGIIARDMIQLAKPNLDGFKVIQSLTSVPVVDFLFIGDSHKTDEVIANKLGMDFFYYKD